MKINDIVRYKKFPFEKELFIIVGDKKNPWLKPSPYHPGGKKIFVEDNHCCPVKPEFKLFVHLSC